MARSGDGSGSGTAAGGRPVGGRQVRVPRPSMSWRPGLLAGTLGGAGFAAGLGLMRLGIGGGEEVRGFTATLQFQTWAAVVAFQLTLWGALAPGLWRTCTQLWRRLREGPGRRGPGLLLVGYVVLVGLIGVVLRSGPRNPAVPVVFDLRSEAMLVVGLVVVLPPVAVGMWLVQSLLGRLGARLAAAPRDRATLEVDWRSTGRPILGDLLWLRETLQRVLLVGGTVVGVATLAAGSLRLAVLAWRPEASFPPEAPVLYGAFFTVVLAMLYVPAYAALQRLGRALVDACWPLPPDGKPEEAWYRARQNAESTLGLNLGIKDSFQSGAAILAPLLTSVLTVLLPAKPG